MPVAENQVIIARDGNLIAITPITKRVCEPIEKALTYQQVRHIRGKEAFDTGKRIEFINTACYRYKPDEKSPARMVTNFGYLHKIKAALKKTNISVKLVNHRPHPRPHVFEPQWARIGEIQWRHKQKETIKAILANENGRIDCPTGYGKSFIIVQLARLLPHARIDVVVKSTKIARDIHATLCTHLPDVGIVGAGKKHEGRRVMVYTADSLQHSEFDADIVLADEGHELAAPTYLRKLARYRYSRMFMFSASQKRPDRREFELEGVFGPLIMDISYQEAQAANMIVPIEVRWSEINCERNPCDGKTDVPRERAGIWRNPVRNKKIAEIARMYPDDQVLIVVNTVEHAMHLKKHLPEFTLAYETLSEEDRQKYTSWGLIDEDEPYMNTKRKLDLEKQFEKGTLRKVIVTSIWNRGVNFHQLQVLIRADGGGSPIGDTQIPGRVSRLYTDKKVGILHDFMDNFDDGYLNKSLGRRRNYRQKGWTQVDLDKPQDAEPIRRRAGRRKSSATGGDSSTG